MGSWYTLMWIGVGFEGEAGIRAGSVEAISQEEFLEKLDKKGWR
jgi:hypothetical protein